MRVSVALAATGVSLALVALVPLVFDLSFSRAALLAPVIVLSVAAAAAVLILLGRALLEPFRGRARS